LRFGLRLIVRFFFRFIFFLGGLTRSRLGSLLLFLLRRRLLRRFLLLGFDLGDRFPHLALYRRLNGGGCRLNELSEFFKFRQDRFAVDAELFCELVNAQT